MMPSHSPSWLISQLRESLNIPEDAWIDKDGWLVTKGKYEQQWDVVDSGTDRVRYANPVDKALFVLENELRLQEQQELEKSERALLVRLKEKYEKLP